MTGTGIAARLTHLIHCASAASWLRSRAKGVRRRQDVESGRLLFDNRFTPPRSPTVGKSQFYRRNVAKLLLAHLC